MSTDTATLRRYTNLASALLILTKKKLTLLSPAQWDDRNDAYFMRRYKEQSNKKTVLALCFSQSAEEYHYWRVFSHGIDGVLFEFDASKLKSALRAIPNVRAKSVTYKTVEALETNLPPVADWPFVKRFPFKAEDEFRIVYSDSAKSLASYDIPIQLSWIKKIRISPWIHPAPYDAVKATLKALPGCGGLTVERSKMIDYDRWKEALDGRR